MNWINVENQPIPKDGKEYLTKNELQGNTKNLVRFNLVHKHFTIKGNYVAEVNAGTHWIEIPD